MTTEIGRLIFSQGKTLFEVLDSLDVPQVSAQLEATNERLDMVNDQLRQLGEIVDSNNNRTNAEFIRVNTELDNLTIQVQALNVQISPLSAQVASLDAEVMSLSAELTPLSNEIDDLNDQVQSLSLQVNALSSQVSGYTSRITTLESQLAQLTTTVNALTSTVNFLDANRARLGMLYLGNEYLFSYRTGGVPGNVYTYRINYSGNTTTQILANVGYTANVLSSEDNTSTSRTVRLAAPFDLFSTNGRVSYPLVQGPCVLSFTVNNTNPTNGYITHL